MATPKNINIEFNATGNLKEAIKALAKEYKKFQTQTNQVAQSTKQLSNEQKFSAEILKDMTRRNKQQTKEDVERVAALKKKAIAEKKAAEAAKKHAQAQKILSVNSVVNRAKIQGLNKTLKRMGSGFKEAGISAEVLKRALKGNAAAMGAVSKASTLLISKTKKLKSGLFTISNDGRLLSNTFATLRSRMLLFAFASTVITKLLVDQVKAFGKQEASVRRLADVFGGEAAKNLNEYSSELQQNSTFGDENINMLMAQIGAFGASEEQTKKLAQATIDLSAGLGIDLNSAGLLVAKTIGSSTDALTRYGVGADGAKTQSEKVANVIASVEEKFGGLGKVLSQTTEGQLAQAQNAIGDMAENFGQVLAPAVLFAAKLMKSFSEMMTAANIKRFSAALIGLGVVVSAHRIGLALATQGTVFFKLANIGLTGAITKARAAMTAFQAAARKNPYGLIAAGLATVTALALEYFGVFNDNQDEIDEAGKQLRRLDKGTKEYTESVEQSEAQLKEQLAILNATSEAEKLSIKLKRDLTAVEIQHLKAIEAKRKELKLQEDILKQQEAHEKNILSIITEVANFDKDATLVKLENKRSLIDAELQLARAVVLNAELAGQSTEESARQTEIMLKLEDTLGGLDSKIRDYTESTRKKTEAEIFNESVQKKLQSAYDETKEAQMSLLSEQIKAAEKMKELSPEQLEGLKLMKEEFLGLAFNFEVPDFTEIQDAMSEHFQGQIEEARAAAEAKMAIYDQEGKAEIEALKKTRLWDKKSRRQQQNDIEEVNKKTEKKKAEARKEANKQMLVQFRLNQGLAIAEAVMNTSQGYTKALGQGGIFGIPMAAIVATLGAVQVAMIAAQKPPKMAQGGLVGGKLHSQGGTMIEAEQGEFVMNRDAVDAIGAENLNRMNRGGGAGANITFSGNVMSDDFIENEAIPKIKEAVRRGSDIGVS